MELSPVDASAAGESSADFDTSHAAQGYVGVSATGSSRLKVQVTCDGESYNYDISGDGTPVVCPLNMGDGLYEISVYQNTSGNRYAILSSTSVWAEMDDEFQPYIRPSVYCSYDETSACVAKAAELTAGASCQAQAAANIYQYVIDSIKYDQAKAQELADQTGYVPDPDETLASGTGICFDYASLTAAMMRSVGIPCKIITGSVSPNNIYHAWNMVYLDGTWKTISFTVDPETWTRIDATFAASGGSSTVGDGTSYIDQYTY